MTDKEKKISVIIPIYNKEKYLERCLRSIEEQAYECYEVIMLDDGSTDKSADICREYAARNKRFVYIYQDNVGLQSSRKNGLEHADSEYICYIDADDWIDGDFLEELMRPVNNNSKLDFVVSDLSMDYPSKSFKLKNGVKTGIYAKAQIMEMVPNIILDIDKMSPGIIHSMSGKIFKKDILKNTFDEIIYRLLICEDGVTVFSYITSIDNMCVLDYAGYHYVQLEDSFIHRIEDEKLKSLIDLKNQYKNIAEKKMLFGCVNKDIARHISETFRILMGRSLGLKTSKRYVIPQFMCKDNCKVAIYAAGKMGELLKRQIDDVDDMTVVAWVDKQYSKFAPSKNILPVECLLELKYDYLFIAVENPQISHQIMVDLNGMGIDLKKIWILDTIDYYE